MTTNTTSQPTTPHKITKGANSPPSNLAHPPLQYEPFNTITSFNALNNLYATLDPSSLQPKVLIYNVQDSKPILDFTINENSQITTIKWLNKINENDNKKSGKKDPYQRFRNCMLLGCSNGDIIVYSLTESAIVTKLAGRHNGAINDIFQIDHLIFSGSKDEHLGLWNIGTGEIVKFWRPSNGCITRIIASQKSSQLIVAGNSIQIWDYEDFTLLKTFRGHTGAISTLSYFGNQDRYFLSSSPHDPLVNVWDRLHDTELPVTVLDLQTHHPYQLIGFKFTSSYTAVILSSDGLLLVYNDVLNLEKNSMLATAQLQFYNSENNTIIPISSLAWDIRYNVPLVGRGLPTNPSFETLQIKLSNVKGIESYPRKGIETNRNINNVNAKVAQEAMELIVGTSFAQTANTSQIHSKLMVPTAIATAQRLNLLDEGRGDSPSTSSDKNVLKSLGDGKATTGSVVQLLSQALHTMDYDMLDSHLNSFNAPTLVQTVPNLETKHLVPLLLYLADQMEFSNHTSIKALTLINSLLTYHVGYLTSQPKAILRLTQLMEGSERRTAHYSQLVQLEGELELVQNRINLRKQTFHNDESLVFKESKGHFNSVEDAQNIDDDEDEDKMDLIEFEDLDDDSDSDDQNETFDEEEEDDYIEDILSKEARLEANLNKNGFFDSEDEEEDEDNAENDEDEDEDEDDESDENDEEEADSEDIEEGSEEEDFDDLDLPVTKKPNGIHQRKRAKH